MVIWGGWKGFFLVWCRLMKDFGFLEADFEASKAGHNVMDLCGQQGQHHQQTNVLEWSAPLSWCILAGTLGLTSCCQCDSECMSNPLHPMIPRHIMLKFENSIVPSVPYGTAWSSSGILGAGTPWFARVPAFSMCQRLWSDPQSHIQAPVLFMTLFLKLSSEG